MARSVYGETTEELVESVSGPADVRGGIMGFVRHTAAGRTGAVILLAYVVIAIFATEIAPHPPLEIFTSDVLSPPSWSFPFGTDANGMDVLSRVIVAARLDLMIAGAAVGLSAVVGVVLGLAAGLFGRIVDLVLVRIMDVLQSFPVVILGLAIVAASGGSVWDVIFVIALLDVPVYLRLVRANVLRIKGSAFVENARAVGNPTWRLVLRHILPHSTSSVVIETATRLAYAVQITAALSFVGVGVQAPTPEWGAMMKQGAGNLVAGQWWVAIFPGIALLILVLGLNLFADGLQDYLDPRRGHR